VRNARAALGDVPLHGGGIDDVDDAQPKGLHCRRLRSAIEPHEKTAPCRPTRVGYLGLVKTVKIGELKNNLSRFLSYVRRGGTVRVFDRETAVADLVPCRPVGDTDSDAMLADLERAGVLRRGTRGLSAKFARRRLPKAKASVVKALLDDRREDR
jgi:antitoxin (DNA-binding transcriptional repressor) of toxin-antitoxin stability system